MGDQPEAIRRLVDGVKKGLKHQVLLGATGTGKSLGYDECLYLGKEIGNRREIALVKMGFFIDELFEKHAHLVQRTADNQVLHASELPERYYSYSFDPLTGRPALHRISAFTRHKAPGEMFRLETACGRAAVMTGDHNLWTLRDGCLRLVNTADVKPGDYIAIPASLPADDFITEIDALSLLDDARLFVESKEALLAYADVEENRALLYKILYESGISSPAAKLRAIYGGNRGRGIQVNTFLNILEITSNLNNGYDPHLTTVGGKQVKNRLPARIPLTPEFLRFLGYYIAEGNAQERYIILANVNPAVRARIEAALAQLGIPFSVRFSSDYQISSAALTKLLHRLCGAKAREKRLPDFAFRLSQQDLGCLLQAYFDGDGTVGRACDITAITASERLASDLAYALFRFGIWARIARRRKRATNSDHAGDWYYQITISGQADLQAFYERINFSIPEKRKRLESQLGKLGNSNVDVVPINGADLRTLRSMKGLTASQVAGQAGISRSALQFMETGSRRPQRRILLSILEALRDDWETMPLDWRETWMNLYKLCHVHWTPVARIVQVDYSKPYVYDLTVPGAETFLAGSGGLFVHNTFTIASVIQEVQKPALIMAHNKTLAAQLYAEFKEFFPHNAVSYFVSYYDYYQPEAYVPRHDLYIEKETQINEEIERLRLAATTALLSRRDVIIVASVSCIYGLGSPEEFGKGTVTLKVGEIYRRNALLRQLIESQYQRNDMELRPGAFRVRGDTLEIIPAYEEKRGYKIAFFGDEVERILEFSPLTGEIFDELREVSIYPAKQYLTAADRLKEAIANIEAELEERLAFFKSQGKYLEAQRLEQRTRYDLEMLKEVGYCSGIENYSRHLDGRAPGTHPWTLIDFLPSDYLLVIDESHMTVPQIRGMYNGDRSRKETLVEYGFRLPSALDNRPLKFEEFEQVMGTTIYTSATPGPYEMEHAEQVVEQIIRPTGLVDPEVSVRPVKGQVDDLLGEIKQRVERGERVLVTTLTKRMAEDLTKYLQELGVKVQYLHSEVETLERVGILRDLRLGMFDVVVGINLLREGLDLPEVSLVAILDADKEGFLRSDTALIQTIGRAARHVNGRVIMYAERVTDSMKRAIDETNRRRAKQIKFNEENGIVPISIHKEIHDLTEEVAMKAVREAQGEYRVKSVSGIPRNELLQIIAGLEKQMKEAAKNLEFEKAAAFRDELYELKSLLVEDESLKPWERIKLLSGEELD